jgi:hypothetical protein
VRKVLEVRRLPPGEPSLARAVKGARYAVRLEEDEHVRRAGGAVADGWRETMPALRSLALESAPGGATLRFEINLDQTEGETSTPKKVLESLLAIPPHAQAVLSVVREAMLLGP